MPVAAVGRILTGMSEPTSSLERLLADLKRRKVFRVMAVYGATAFVVLQVVDLAFPRLGLPEWTITFILVATLAGFPIAVALAWAFDSTPDGVVRTADAAPGELEAIAAQPALNRWPAGLLALAGVALLFGSGWWMGRRGGPDTVAGTTAPAVVEAGAKSVAVLPFVDMSEAGDQEWFADGLTEEILNSLAALPELRVTARTSSFQFRDLDRDIKEIADTLGVAHVVEGSVRRIGDELIVTAQLIRATDGTHLWSNRYERAADDLFDVQRDVAERVATALNVLLDADRREAMFRSGTSNVEAFEAYLRGVDELARWHSDERESAPDAGQAAFERALELDPGYAEAALAHMDLYSHALMDGMDIGMSQEEVREALLHDLEVAAKNASNPTTRLVAEINTELFSRTWHRMGGLVAELGAQPDVEQIRTSKQGGWLRHMLILADRSLARRIAEADTTANPLDPSAWMGIAMVTLSDGDPEAALEMIERGRRRAGNVPMMNGIENLIGLRDDPSPAHRWIERLEPASREFPEQWLLPAYRALGDDASLASLTRRIDSLPAGSAIFVQMIALSGTVPFDLADAPNFARRIDQAGIDLVNFGTPLGPTGPSRN